MSILSKLSIFDINRTLMLTNCCLIFSFQKSLPSDIEGGACVVGYLDEYLSVSKPWVDVDTMICFDSFGIRQASAKNR